MTVTELLRKLIDVKRDIIRLKSEPETSDTSAAIDSLRQTEEILKKDLERAKAKDAKPDKIKLEDMTLAQIREAKDTLRDNIKSAVEEVVNSFNDKYDAGEVLINLMRQSDSETYDFESIDLAHVVYSVDYSINIKFSKEDE